MNKKTISILSITLLVTAGVIFVSQVDTSGVNLEMKDFIVTFSDFDHVNENALTKFGATILEKYNLIPSMHIMIPEIMIKHVARLPGVIAVEQNMEYQKDIVPNDPQFGSLYGMSIIQAPEAWDVHTGSGQVIVAVIDEGVDINHEDLAANIWTNPGEIPNNGVDDDGNGFVDDVNGWNFIDNNNQVYGGNPSQDTHGTHVSGTIGAVGNNGVGVVGVNWNVKIMPLKFLGPFGGSTADAISAIEYATMMGADIISASWGGGGFSLALKNAIEAFGGLFVAAAGNSGIDTDISPHYPSSYDSPNIISVASTTATDARSSFSNYGATSVDLGAPGSSILSTYPANSYATISGTSMATPHVSGAAALILSHDPTLTTAQLKARILDNVDPVPSMQGVTVSGGRLNVFKALTAGAPPPPDTVAPSVTIVSPIGTVSGTVTVEATITDNVGVSTAQYSVDGGAFVPMSQGAGNSWTATLDTTTLTNGVHTIVVQGFDAAGNMGSDSGTFTVDNTVPPPPTADVSITGHSETPGQYKARKGELKGMVSSVSGTVTGSPTNIIVSFTFPASWSLKALRSATLDVGGTTFDLTMNVAGNTFSVDITSFVSAGDSFTLTLVTEWKNVPAGPHIITAEISFYNGTSTMVTTDSKTITL